MQGSSALTSLTASKLLHDRRGRQGDLLGDAVRTLRCVAVAAHGEECDESDDEHERESGHHEGVAGAAGGGSGVWRGFGRARVVLTHEVLPQERQSGSGRD